MALKGNLRDFTITQLLNLINLARKTGRWLSKALPIRPGLMFREGKLSLLSTVRKTPAWHRSFTAATKFRKASTAF
jgi:hypothetical protein